MPSMRSFKIPMSYRNAVCMSASLEILKTEKNEAATTPQEKGNFHYELLDSMDHLRINLHGSTEADTFRLGEIFSEQKRKL